MLYKMPAGVLNSLTGLIWGTAVKETLIVILIFQSSNDSIQDYSYHSRPMSTVTVIGSIHHLSHDYLQSFLG